MTPDDFRQLALSLPDTSEQAHMGHPDFRVGGKIFATLGFPRDGFGVVVLDQADQAMAIHEHPHVFTIAPGGWGQMGATIVDLAAARSPEVLEALTLAWTRRTKRSSR